MSAGDEFLKKLEAIEAEIRVGSDKMADLQAKVPEENREEISSRIDMAIGSASLILSGKCKQFRELCQKNIREAGDVVDTSAKEGAEFPTTRQDLEGFWDMIAMPIQKVRDGFAAIERLKESGWKIDEVDNEQQQIRIKKNSAGAKTNGQPKKPLASRNENDVVTPAEAERREKLAKQKEEARKRLLEFKKAAKDRLIQQNGTPSGEV